MKYAAHEVIIFMFVLVRIILLLTLPHSKHFYQCYTFEGRQEMTKIQWERHSNLKQSIQWDISVGQKAAFHNTSK